MWTGLVNVDRPYSVNGLNQLTSSGGVPLGYDLRGNLSSSGSASYSYGPENLLAATNGGLSFYYDGVGRLVEYTSSVSTRFFYNGNQMAAEVANPGGGILRRYVWGADVDEALVWYEGSGTGDKRWLHADERGSVVAVSDASGAVTNINSYDEYGIPGAGNVGRFQNTGQAWLPELGMYYYKARIYSPTLGRFLQTDPIGYADGLNWYNYVGGDPVNATDPSGLHKCTKVIENSDGSFEVVVTAGCDGGGGGGGYFLGLFRSGPVDDSGALGGGGGAGARQSDQTPQPDDIVVNGRRLPHPRAADPRWPVPMRPNGCTGVPDVFKQSCNVHDICYVTPGVARQICDRQFYFNMLVERPDKKGLALDYYIGVINIGDRFYRDGQRLGRDFQRRYGR